MSSYSNKIIDYVIVIQVEEEYDRREEKYFTSGRFARTKKPTSFEFRRKRKVYKYCTGSRDWVAHLASWAKINGAFDVSLPSLGV